MALFNSKDVKDAFERYSEGRGYLERFEVKCVFAELFGFKPSGHAVRAVLSGLPEERIELADFQDYVYQCQQQQAQEPISMVREAFKAFDIRSAGFISRDDWHRVFQRIAPFMKHHVVSQAFYELDVDRDGRISLAEFVSAMQAPAAGKRSTYRT